MEFYQYLLRKNGFSVSYTGYFIYCNGIRQKKIFNEKLDFEIFLLDYTGNDSWIEETLSSIVNVLKSEKVPKYSDNCKYCDFIKKTQEIVN